MIRKFFYACAILILCLKLVPVAESADKKPFSAMAADKESNYVIASPQGLSVDVYNPRSQKLLYSINFSEFVTDFSGISALAIDDANLLAACAVAKKNAPAAIYLFDLQKTKLRGIIPGLSSAPSRLAFSGNGRYLAFASDQQGLMIYKIIHVIKPVSSSAASLSAPEKESLSKLGYLEREMIDPVPALYDKSIRGNITALSYDNRENLAVGADDGTLRLFDSNLKPVKTINVKNGTNPSCIRFSPDDTRIAVAYADKASIDIYSAIDLTYLFSPNTTDIASAFTGNVAWSTDGRFLYAAVPALQKDETDIYRWRSSGEGSRYRLKTIEGKTTRIAPVMGGGLLYADSSNGISLTDKQYGTVYNDEWLSVWLAAGHKYGHVTYQIGGDYSNSEGASGSYWFPISELKWPINTVMGEFGFTLRAFKRLELQLSGSHNVTNNFDAKMEDSDWSQNSRIRDIYSESETDFRGYTVDGQIRFWILDRHYSNDSYFTLGAGAGFTYQNYNWQASNGYQWSSTPEYYAGPLPGAVCTYQSQLYMPYLELVIKSKIGKVDITGAMGGSPYLLAKDEDDHQLRYKIMKTDARGYSLKGDIQANYNFTPNWFAGVRLNVLYFNAKGTQKGYQYADVYENNRWYLTGYQWDIEHEIKSFQMDTLLLMGFRF